MALLASTAVGLLHFLSWKKEGELLMVAIHSTELNG